MNLETSSSAPVCGTFRGRLAAIVAHGQGWFYILGGIWPVISPRTFQAITGDKLDFWLAQLVGVQLALVGVLLVLATRARRLTRELVLLGLGQALILAAFDVYCVTQPRTTPAYLLDAVAELAIATGWVVVLWRGRDNERSR